MKSDRELNGYRLVYNPSNSRAMQNESWKGYVYEHVKVAQQFMGRPLREEEIVHHLDGDRANNNPKNLLVIDKSQHVKLHEWLAAGAPFGETLSVNRVNCGKSKWSVTKRCPMCDGVVLNPRAVFCSLSCSALHNRKSKRPPKEELLEKLNSGVSFLSLGKHYKVSDNAVRKWCISYNIDYKTIRSQAREFHRSSAKVQRLVGDEKADNPTTTPDTQTGSAVGGDIVHGAAKAAQT